MVQIIPPKEAEDLVKTNKRKVYLPLFIALGLFIFFLSLVYFLSVINFPLVLKILSLLIGSFLILDIHRSLKKKYYYDR